MSRRQAAGTAAPGTAARRPAQARRCPGAGWQSPLRAVRTWWAGRSLRQRHWLAGIVVGIVIDLLVHALGHAWPGGWLDTTQNMGLDAITRSNRWLCANTDPANDRAGALHWLLRCPGSDDAPAPPLLVEVDEQDWRQPAWGGGEPVQAPRVKLAELVRRSFELGARLVVLDVLVEDPVRADDAALADALRSMLAPGGRYADRSLVLVRSERRPLADDQDLFMPEMRASTALDALAADLPERVILAAPYFQRSADLVTREWTLFRALCQRRPGTAAQGQMAVLPSVQLVTRALAEADKNGPAALQALLRYPVVPPAAQAAVQPAAQAGAAPASPAPPPCLPMPAQGPARQRGLGQQPAPDLAASYWAALRQAIRLQPLLGPLPGPHDLGNRIAFRLGPGDVHRLSVRGLAQGSAAEEDGLKAKLHGRTVVIGQSHALAGDEFDTPLGRMSGPLLLVNAIDSMAVRGLINSPSPGVTLPAALLGIVLVAWFFAYCRSGLAASAATLAVLALWVPASALFWTYGVWLDFVVPVIGIFFHSRLHHAGNPNPHAAED